MPNTIERLFRAVFLYTSLFWIITGLWGIPQAWIMWGMWESHGIRSNNELYCLGVLLLVYGSKLIVGMIGVCYFRELATRQYQLIPGIADMPEPKWHETGVFAMLTATLTGLYSLHYCFVGLFDLVTPLLFLAKGHGDMSGVAAIDVWYYHWQPILVCVCCLLCAILLFAYTGKIVAFVTQMVETTPLPKEEDMQERAIDEQDH